MSCYHPRQMVLDGLTKDGNLKFRMLKTQGEHLPNDLDNPLKILVPCRKCIGCRLDYAKRWADRLMLELDHTGKALFFTLTYDDEHVTYGKYDDVLKRFWYSLNKKDVQDFNKRLRYYFPGREIRFFLAGEYGDSSLRPHYHGIYFNLSLDDFPDVKPLFLNEFNQQIYTSEFLASIWQNGHVSIGNVSWQSCAYVARYNLKKLGKTEDNPAINRGCLPEFALMSRNPGIGGKFLEDHPEFFDNPRDKIVITDLHGVKSVGLVNPPSYFFEKLKLVNPELYDIIKAEKKEAAHHSFMKELAGTDLSEFEYLDMKESLHEKSAKLLKRPLDS